LYLCIVLIEQFAPSKQPLKFNVIINKLFTNIYIYLAFRPWLTSNEKRGPSFPLLFLPHCAAKWESKRRDMLALFFLAILAHACSVRPQQFQPKNIFILAGQSNMVGLGGVVNGAWDGIVPTQSGPNQSILQLSANLTWVPAHEPLHADIDTKETIGIGPGMAFANVVLAKDPTFGVIGLVPCAIGGTSISEWGKGTLYYKQLVRRAQAALQDGGTIQALLWYQGESDTVTKEGADSYKAKLETFFLDVREDLKSPILPIIQVRFILSLI
jgi:hypothetical protein